MQSNQGRYSFPTALAVLCAAFFSPEPAKAQPGPGLGNLDCGDEEYFQPFAFIENDSDPRGTNVSVMIRGYFMTVFAPDSGHPPGEIALYDLSDPKSPVEVDHIENADTDQFREAHSLPVALIDDRQYIAFQTISGIQFWDFTDPLAAERIGSIDLPGVNGGDYENVAWQTFWQGRYLYVSGGNQGIYVVDAADPANPELLKQVPTSQTGGFRVGPLFALGDHLVISNMDLGGAYAILDISIPDQPALLARLGNLARIYAIAVGGNDRIYAAGRDGNFLTHSFTDPTNIALIKDALIGEDQLYAAAQDHFVFLGRQNNVVKVDVSDEQNPMVVGQGTLGRSNPDHGQVTPMGNLIFIGNDHGTGSALFCHQRGQDTVPPTVESTFPKDGSLYVASTARLGLIFSDYIDTETVTPESVVIRRAGGEPVDGTFTYAFNILSFGPTAPLDADTTYEVVLPAGGVADVMGNTLSEEVQLRFSTGDSLDTPGDTATATTGTGGVSGTTDTSTSTGTTDTSAGGMGATGGVGAGGGGGGGGSSTVSNTVSGSTGVGTGGNQGAQGTTGSTLSGTSGPSAAVGGGPSSTSGAKAPTSSGGCAVGGDQPIHRSASLGLLLLVLTALRRTPRRA